MSTPKNDGDDVVMDALADWKRVGFVGGSIDEPFPEDVQALEEAAWEVLDLLKVARAIAKEARLPRSAIATVGVLLERRWNTNRRELDDKSEHGERSRRRRRLARAIEADRQQHLARPRWLRLTALQEWALRVVHLHGDRYDLVEFLSDVDPVEDRELVIGELLKEGWIRPGSKPGTFLPDEPAV